MTTVTDSESATRALGERIGSRLKPGTIILLVGTLGAGKTALAKGIATGLGVRDTVTSPTYTIVSEYQGRLPLHHIDLYRVSGDEEFLQLGLDDLLYGHGVSLIEWPERAGDEVPSPAHRVEITIQNDGRRLVTVPDQLLGEGADA